MPPGMDAGASPIGAQRSSSARYGRICHRAELELRAPDGRGQCRRAGCARHIRRFAVRGRSGLANDPQSE